MNQLENQNAKNEVEHKKIFVDKVYKKENYRRITKEEACMIQGFPKDYVLPESRARWMKLIGNSVSVPVIEMLGKAIIETGVFNDKPVSKLDTAKLYTMPTYELQTSKARLNKASL